MKERLTQSKEQRAGILEDTEFHFTYFTIWAPSHILPEIIKDRGTYNTVDPDPTGDALRACAAFNQEQWLRQMINLP